MKYITEYRDAGAVRKIAHSISKITTKNWALMEICGGQTHSIMKYALNDILPDTIRLIHGPGCPVCVTPLEAIDSAIVLAQMDNVIFCTFGDMMRVPGSKEDLLSLKAKGCDIRIIYSPLDAVKIARENPDHEIIFFAIGFETTAPTDAMAVYVADKEGLKNFSIISSHVLVPPAMEAILSSDNNQVNGFLAAGHVCTVMGYTEYESLAQKYKVPIVVTGFEPVDILHGIYLCIKQLEEGSFRVDNEYSRVVKREGNLSAQKIMKEVFKVSNQKWRGIGQINNSGLTLQNKYHTFDACSKFNIGSIVVDEPKECIAGLILQGIKRPDECGEFSVRCNPQHPKGAPMVSSEGACAAYFKYK